MSKLAKLRAAKTKPELADVLGVHPSFLTYTLYVRGTNSLYTFFNIPKKSGGVRTIQSPDSGLKSIQSALSNLLLDCIDEINLANFPDSELASPKASHSNILKVKCNSAKTKQPSLSHGFTRHRSIITNAMMHVNKKAILNIDLKDFFSSFNFGRVRGFFIKNKNFELDDNVATTIAQIACHDNELPQGSPCSPVITNLITHSLDIRLADLARKNSCTYSRYADDITFSTGKRKFPSEIVSEENGICALGKKLKSEVRRSGFSINSKKTRVLYKDSRQDVTGLIVNKKPNIKAEYWRTVRAQCNLLFKTGKFYDLINNKEVEGNIYELEGKLNFIDQLDHYNRLRQKPALNPQYHRQKDALAKGGNQKQRRYLYNNREKTFSNFLFYKLFYANPLTMILTEGKTDNIYLKAALSRLATAFPSLAKSQPYEPLCQFFKYTERTRFLLELHGGGDYFKSFVGSYEERYRLYKAPKPANPVIIFVDNDTGPDQLISRIKGMKGIGIYPTSLNKGDIRKSDFVHISNNLYLILTPQSNTGDNTDIEYFFTDFDRKRPYNGKCFNTVKLRNDNVDLSKDAFSRHIVQAKKNVIDFSGFHKLLERIVLVQNHYKTL